MGKQWYTLFYWAPKSLQMVTAAMKLKDTPWKKSYDQSRQHIKKADIWLCQQRSVLSGYGFSVFFVCLFVFFFFFPMVTYGCESWTIKKAKRWRTDAFELWCWRRLLRVPWTARRSNQSILKDGLISFEISPEYSLEGLDGEAETPIVWPPDGKSWLIWKDPDAGQDWRQEDKGMSEDEMAGWHHWLDQHEFE